MTDDGDPEWLLVCVEAGRCMHGTGGLLGAAFYEYPHPLAVCDVDLRVVWSNGAMQRAVGMTEEQLRGLRPRQAVDHPVVGEDERTMRRVLATGESQYREDFLRVPGEEHEHLWAVDISPVMDVDGDICGVLFSARDRTEQYWSRRRLQLTNEASARIGRTLDVEQVARELAEVAVPAFADRVIVDLLPFLHRGDKPPAEPPAGPVTVRRYAEKSLAGTPENRGHEQETVIHPEASPLAECLTTGRSARYTVTEPLIHNWSVRDPALVADIREIGTHSLMVVPLRARDVILGVACFGRHRHEEPFVEDDLLLAEEITARAAVCIDNASQYVRERETSVTLQRSLLPRKLPDHTGVDLAARYLPTDVQAGVGGDWYDVIPLSGARVALVVGDVAGHGIQASVAMGRLRTAMRSLADTELQSDELLTRLDDLVLRQATQVDTWDGDGTQVDIGATCLYAIYDPIAHRCTVASAGHPPPVVVTPDGTARILDLPTGPPLGVGGLPFEPVEIDLPEGSLLALYTDGLIETREHDLDAQLATLGDVLARPAPSLDATCDTVLETLPPERTDDDIALLLARTHVLGSEAVATWDVPSDPAAVTPARRKVTEQLARWGLDELNFTTELVVSELVTNAIRHGQPPVRLRLIHDRTLICEVSDASSAAPHLRRSRAYDEGGRGLLLVAQLTQRWGTRHDRQGKTIWAEQHLPSGQDS
ncbi:SpoIIE family protein phosphatase [Streptomyces sp. B5E4]|uniref:SpoIIE family protein phosphatase n=1 Tax=Streptomyces sp. B5E4 TaxID=3153568 RepID=UPI00325C4B4D